MSLKKEGLVLSLDLLMKWMNLDRLPAQDPEWLIGEERHPIGLDSDGNSGELRVQLHDNKLEIEQTGCDGPVLSGNLVFNGAANGIPLSPNFLTTNILFPRDRYATTPDLRIENPPERAVKALCQGFYMAMTYRTPLGTDANPLSRIESGEAADDLDVRMNGANYTRALSVTRQMFGP